MKIERRRNNIIEEKKRNIQTFVDEEFLKSIGFKNTATSTPAPQRERTECPVCQGNKQVRICLKPAHRSHMERCVLCKGTGRISLSNVPPVFPR